MLKKLAAISLTAGALVLMAPAVATAAPSVPTESGTYPAPPAVKVDDPIIDVCEVSTIVFGPDYFLPAENVNVSVSGLDAGKAAVSGNTAAADGSLTLTFRPPSDGDGSYAVAFAGSRSYTATITVSQGHDSASNCDHDPVVAAAGVELPLSGDGFELALTGGSVSPWILGGGAVALVAGGALVATGAARRKRA
ncbi:hypothetical protein [Microbacterium sp. 179-I 3D3 NHS]|uniref:hypothetical protein n=1 Tax=unclassified Microbacterium TaxID=2609290 RepID=UPI00399F5E37